MNKMYKYLVVSLLACFTYLPAVTTAQNSDTMVVPWLDGNDVLINSLYIAIVSDTLANGERANLNRIYKLEKGGIYYITERIENNGFPLRIVGEPGDVNDPAGWQPIIQLEHRDDASRADRMFAFNGDVVLKNVTINGKSTLGDLPYETLNFNAADAEILIDNVVFEYAGWGIMGFYGQNSSIVIQNSTFRNLLSPFQFWGGRGLSVWANTSSMRIENNTFFNVGGFAIQVEGAVVNDFWVNHNTFVNVGRQPVLYPWHIKSYFTNNLIVNGWWQGEGAEGFNSIRLDQPDNQYTGVISLNSLPSEFGLDAQRLVVISNNSYYVNQTFRTYFQNAGDNVSPGGGGVRLQPFVNVRTQNFADEFENITIQNTFEGIDPGLLVNANNFNQMVNFVSALRAGNENPSLWYWDPNRDQNDHYSLQWPFPENLSYTNSNYQSAAFGGYPLGNLNWFPDRKAQWLNDKDQIEDEIRSLGGTPPALVNVGRVEAEKGTLTGSASVVTMEDKILMRVEGSGEPIWTFNLSHSGTYDIRLEKRTWYADNNPDRASNIVLNNDNVGTVTMGIEITPDLPWASPVLTGVSIPAGSNSIKIGRNWGWMEYRSLTILEAGTSNVVLSLPAAIADPNNSSIACSGALCASGDQYVDVSNGGVEITKNLETAGQYILIFSYLNPTGTNASADITVNGQFDARINFDGSDSDFRNVELGTTLSSGNNTIRIDNTGGSLGLDYVSFFLLDVSTSVDREYLPSGFVLDQNYPNPFNPTTNIAFTLPYRSDITLEVYSVLGQRVAKLAQGSFAEGVHTIQFDASNLASGTYIYRLTGEGFIQTRKMMLIK